MEKEKILQILNNNKNKNFIKRIIDPEKYSVIKNQDDSISTHMMAYGKIDNKFVVYPEIIMDTDSTLKRLTPNDAIQHAMLSGEYISFENEKDAADFSKTYKSIWDE
jgi:hypothetical protein